MPVVDEDKPKKHHDLESGGNKNGLEQYKDVASQKESADRRNQLKEKILNGIDKKWTEGFRKSPEEVCAAPRLHMVRIRRLMHAID